MTGFTTSATSVVVIAVDAEADAETDAEADAGADAETDDAETADAETDAETDDAEADAETDDADACFSAATCFSDNKCLLNKSFRADEYLHMLHS
jgi:hypothetical protein